ncbi:MAG: thiol-disulfide oxidoreductase DCC family protein [Desulfobacterales bacterium]
MGVKPKVCAALNLILGLHVTGMVIASNSEVDDGTLALFSMLVLAFSPTTSFYGPGRFNPFDKSKNYSWPIFLFMLSVGVFYSTAGLNKAIQEGLLWPFNLHLDYLAYNCLERSLFVGSRFAEPFICSGVTQSYLFSVVAGSIAFVGELGFICILWFPRYRWFFVVSMSLLHIFTLLMAGINFVGNTLLLFVCLDWNVLIRKFTAYFDDRCGICQGFVRITRKLDWFGRIHFVGISKINPEGSDFDINLLSLEMGGQDEDGEIYYGVDVMEQIANRCPPLWVFALLMKVPGVIFMARWIYKKAAKNRLNLGCQLKLDG